MKTYKPEPIITDDIILPSVPPEQHERKNIDSHDDARDISFKYDAFISYRHLAKDEAVAKKLQKLLEQYHHPKMSGIDKDTRIKRIFRDTTELPTSGDLGNALTDALLSSRFLIVILSEKTKESRWCMEEIRQFKKRCGGKISSILPVLVSGEPSDVFPEELLSEMVEMEDDNGNTITLKRDVEPLCADVRSDSIGRSLKKLNTEFLRIAAPLLGCGYDDLYQRHARRHRTILITVFSSVTAILLLVSTVIGILAYQRYLSEQRYKRNLLDTYTNEGSSWLLRNGRQEALMYYGNALELDSDAAAANAGALLLLQQEKWPYLFNEREGSLPEDLLSEKYNILDEDGTVIFKDNNGNTVSEVTYPDALNPKISEFGKLSGEHNWGAFAREIGNDRAAVRYGGYIYIYDISGKTGKLLKTIDIAELFPEIADKGGVDSFGFFWLSDDGSLMAIEEGTSVGILNLETMEFGQKYTIYGYGLNSVVFSKDNSRYALVYGNYMGIDYYNPGGFVQVFNINGDTLMKSDEDSGIAPIGAAFSPDGRLLISWGSGSLQFFDVDSGKRFAESLECKSLKSARFEENDITVDMGQGLLYSCGFTGFTKKPDDSDIDMYAKDAENNEKDYNGKDEDGYGDGDEGEGEDDINNNSGTNQNTGKIDTEEVDIGEINAGKIDTSQRILEVGDGLKIERYGFRVSLEDEDGNEITRVYLNDLIADNMYVDAENEIAYLWRRDSAGILLLPFDKESKTFGEQEIIDTRGFEINKVFPIRKGLIVVTGNGHLLYYEFDNIHSPMSLKLGHGGVVTEIATNEENSLAAVITKRAYFPDPSRHNFNLYYEAELWDLQRGMRIADFEDDNIHKLENISFASNGYLEYYKNGERITWLISAGTPDETTVSSIRSISCFTLDENQTLILKEKPETHKALGNWQEMLETKQYSYEDIENIEDVMEDPATAEMKDEWESDVEQKNQTKTIEETQEDRNAEDEENTEDTEDVNESHGSTDKDTTNVQEIIDNARKILKEQGIEEWFVYYDKIWESVSSGERQVSLQDATDMFDDYVHTGADEGQYDRMRPGLEVYLGLLESADENEFSISVEATFSYCENLLLMFSDAYDELFINYWNRSAGESLKAIEDEGINQGKNKSYESFESYEHEINRVRAYEMRLLAGAAFGEGIEAFENAKIMLGEYYSFDLMEISGMDIFYYLSKGQTKDAAEALEKYIKSVLELEPSELSDIQNQISFMLNEAVHLEKWGVISRENIDKFLSECRYGFGIKLTNVTERNREEGLRIGDIITGINGHGFVSIHHAKALWIEYRNAVLSYLRNNEKMESEEIKDWHIQGEFMMWEKEP